MPENAFVDNFMSLLRNKGVVRSNRFLALINVNQYVASKIGYSSDTIKRRLLSTCFNTGQPTKGFLTHESAITSPVRLIPYAINSNNSSGVSMEFYVLADMFELEFFKMWQSLIVDPVTKEQAYYDDYAKGSSITIIQVPYNVYSLDTALVGERSQMVTGIELTETYPLNFTINNGTLDYAQGSEPMKVRVDFGFREIKSTSADYSQDKWIHDSLPPVDENGNFLERLAQQSLATISQGKGFKIF